MLRSRLIPLSLATVLAFGVGSLGTAFAAQSDLATGTMTAQASSGSSASAEQVAPKAPAKSHAKKSSKKSSTSAHKSSKHSKSAHAAKQPAESTGQKM
ncbi:hypothetical protein [Defluviicoccus vanus]|uniref:Acid-shock protein n=1 Tax=Defluviicoccus vanus TaxID=111831 RepID=A0A7H1N4X2_9PROT|nr:hypothetical protein [Defluviicoccus vanus]QNT70758.1 hypothetical protein HQ394_17335 [Defluviicoccus vanus]